MPPERTKQLPFRLLIVMQLPPPVYGASLMNAYLLDILRQSSLEWEYLPINTAQSISRVGRFGLQKVVSSALVMIQMILKRHVYTHLMLGLSTKGYALIRDYFIIVMAKVLRKRIVLLLRGKGYAQKRGIQALMVARIFRGSSVIQHSDLLLPDILHLSYRDVFFLANGLPDLRPFFPAELRPPSVDAPPVQLIFLSNLMEAKGLFVLIEALDQLVQAGCSFVCHFIGAWTNRNSELRFWQQIRERNLDSVIGEIGPKYDSEKFAFLARMDLLVFPTLNEAFGNVVLEAMICAKPVVVSREGSLPHIVKEGETGLLVPPGQVEPLARALECLIRDEGLRRRMGQNGRRRYLEQFTLEHYQREVLAIFTEIRSS